MRCSQGKIDDRGTRAPRGVPLDKKKHGALRRAQSPQSRGRFVPHAAGVRVPDGT